MSIRQASFEPFRIFSIVFCTIAVLSVIFSGGGSSSLGLLIIVISGCTATLVTLVTVILDPKPIISWSWSGLILTFTAWVWLSVLQATYTNEAILWASVWTSILGMAFSMHYLAKGKTAFYFLGVFLICILLILGISLAEQKDWTYPLQSWIMVNPNSPLATGPFYNPSHFSGFLILSSAVLMGLLFFQRLNFLTLVCLGGLIYLNWINLKTDSSSIPMVLGMIPIMLMMWIIQKNWKAGVALALLFTIGVGWGAMWFKSDAGQIWFKENQTHLGLQKEWPAFIKGREAVWDYGHRMWRDTPVTGAGIGQFAVLSPSYRRDPRITNSPVDRQFVNYTHNDALQIGSELGWIGLLLFTFLLLHVLIVGLKHRTSLGLIASGATIGYLLSGIYDAHITAIPATMMVFYSLVGAALAHSGHGVKPNPSKEQLDR